MLSFINFGKFSAIAFSDISSDILPLFFYYFSCIYIISFHIVPQFLDALLFFSLPFTFSFFPSFFPYPISPQRKLLPFEIQDFILKNFAWPIFKFTNSFSLKFTNFLCVSSLLISHLKDFFIHDSMLFLVNQFYSFLKK